MGADPIAALSALGLEPGADLATIRVHYRAAIRRAHPDAGGDHRGAARLTAAFATLEAAARAGTLPPPHTEASPEPVAEAVEVRIDDDGLVLVAPPDEVFDRLYGALDLVGTVTYADPDGGYLEALLPSTHGAPDQLVVSLQGRAHGTEAFFTLESLDASTAPPIESIVRRVASLVRTTP